MSMCLIPDVGHSVSLLQYRVYAYIFVQLLANCCLHANKTKSSNRFFLLALLTLIMAAMKQKHTIDM